MAKIIGNKPIRIIQGATVDIRRKFDKDVTDNIASVVISCKELGLELNLALTEGGEFTYRLESYVTEKFPCLITTYDMTVTYNDGSVAIQTGVQLVVERRQNPLEEG